MLVDSDIVKDTPFLFCYEYNKDTKEDKYTSFVFFLTHNLRKFKNDKVILFIDAQYI